MSNKGPKFPEKLNIVCLFKLGTLMARLFQGFGFFEKDMLPRFNLPSCSLFRHSTAVAAAIPLVPRKKYEEIYSNIDFHVKELPII